MAVICVHIRRDEGHRLSEQQSVDCSKLNSGCNKISWAPPSNSNQSQCAWRLKRIRPSFRLTSLTPSPTAVEPTWTTVPSQLSTTALQATIDDFVAAAMWQFNLNTSSVPSLQRSSKLLGSSVKPAVKSFCAVALRRGSLSTLPLELTIRRRLFDLRA